MDGKSEFGTYAHRSVLFFGSAVPVFVCAFFVVRSLSVGMVKYVNIELGHVDMLSSCMAFASCVPSNTNRCIRRCGATETLSFAVT